MLRSLPQNYRLAVAQALLVFAAFWLWWPAFKTEYGMADDYIFLSVWGDPDLDLWDNDIVKMGRPGTAILMRLYHLADTSVAGLSQVRLLSACLILFFGARLLRLLNELKLGLLLSFTISLLVITTPPFLVYVGWATMVNASFAAVFALIGSQYSLQILTQPAERWAQGWKGAAAVSSVLIANSLYQPAACLYLLLPLASLLITGKASAVRGALLSISLFVVSLLVYYIAYRSAQTLLFDNNWATARSGLVTDYLGKLEFLWNNSLIDLFGSWTTLSKSWHDQPLWIIGLAASVLAAMGIYRNASPKSGGLITLGIFALGFALSFTPTAVTSLNVAAFRTVAAPHAIWVLFLVIGLRHLARKKGLLTLAQIGLVLFGSVSLFASAKAFRQGIVHLQHTEWMTLKKAFSNAVKEDTRVILYRMPNTWNQTKSVRTHHEFSAPSSLNQWGVDGMILAVQEAFNLSTEPVLAICIHSWDPLPVCDVQIPVVNGYALLSGRPEPAEKNYAWTKPAHSLITIPPFGEVAFPAIRVIYSEDFGYARLYAMPAVDTSNGTPRVQFDKTAGISFVLACTGDTYWTSEEVYPYIVNMHTSQWFTLQSEGNGVPVLIPYVEGP